MVDDALRNLRVQGPRHRQEATALPGLRQELVATCQRVWPSPASAPGRPGQPLSACVLERIGPVSTTEDPGPADVGYAHNHGTAHLKAGRYDAVAGRLRSSRIPVSRSGHEAAD